MNIVTAALFQKLNLQQWLNLRLKKREKNT